MRILSILCATLNLQPILPSHPILGGTCGSHPKFSLISGIFAYLNDRGLQLTPIPRDPSRIQVRADYEASDRHFDGRLLYTK